eukprot:jgi/Mesen1/2558/ME000162S01689
MAIAAAQMACVGSLGLCPVPGAACWDADGSLSQLVVPTARAGGSRSHNRFSWHRRTGGDSTAACSGGARQKFASCLGTFNHRIRYRWRTDSATAGTFRLDAQLAGRESSCLGSAKGLGSARISPLAVRGGLRGSHVTGRQEGAGPTSASARVSARSKARGGSGGSRGISAGGLNEHNQPAVAAHPPAEPNLKPETQAQTQNPDQTRTRTQTLALEEQSPRKEDGPQGSHGRPEGDVRGSGGGARGEEATEGWGESRGEKEVTDGGGGGRWSLFGVELSPDVVAIASVYFVQGILGLPRLAVTFFLKDELGLDPAEVAFLSGISAAPWLIKPLYGFISDGVPLFGYRRRSYLVLCGLLGAASWALLALTVHDKYAAVAATVVDSMVVERARGESQATGGSLQSLCWGSSATGGIVSAYLGGYLVQTYGTRFVFGVTSLLPLITSAVGGLVQEERVSESVALSLAHRAQAAEHAHEHEHAHTVADSPSDARPATPAATSAALVDTSPGVNSHDGAPAASASRQVAPAADARQMAMHQQQEQQRAAQGAPPPIADEDLGEVVRVQLSYLWQTLSQRSILLPTIFIFLWHATPQSDTAMFFFTTNKLGFGPEFLGRVRLITSVASLAGVAVYNAYLKEVPLRRVFFWSTLLGTALGVNRTLGISDQAFSIGDSLILTVLGQVSFMPVLVLAAKLCPPGVEATLFATLMSVSNGGGVTGGLIGSFLTNKFGITSENFDNLAILLVICNASSLLTLPFLKLLPDNDEIDAAVSAAQEKLEAQAQAQSRT